jgi:hypothetical protein
MHATPFGSTALRRNPSPAAMEAIGREAAAIAHDINNPLAGLSTSSPNRATAALSPSGTTLGKGPSRPLREFQKICTVSAF